MVIWFLLIFVLYVFLIAPSTSKRTFKQTHYAHRGFHSVDKGIKQNTLPAFEAAIEKNYGIELDVQLSKDGQVVVYHDDDLFRLEKDKRQVSDCTLEELRTYQLPLLTEVLQTVDGKVPLIVELKNLPFKKLVSFCEQVYDILKEYSGPYCIESFNPMIVAWFKKQAPEVMRGQLIQPTKEYPNVWLGFFLNTYLYQFMTRPHFIAFELKTSHINPSFVINQLLGVQSALWTVRSPKEERANIDTYIFESYFPNESFKKN